MNSYIYPKNKEHFKRLIPFAKEVIYICKEEGIKPLLYGSYSHLYYTRDKDIEVNDIDLIIPKRYFSKIAKALKKNKIEVIPENGKIANSGSLIIKRGDLQVELDEPGVISEKDLEEKKFKKIDFYGEDINIIRLKDLEKIYPIAYETSVITKNKISKQIKSLEKFLGRKLK